MQHHAVNPESVQTVAAAPLTGPQHQRQITGDQKRREASAGMQNRQNHVSIPRTHETSDQSAFHVRPTLPQSLRTGYDETKRNETLGYDETWDYNYDVGRGYNYDGKLLVTRFKGLKGFGGTLKGFINNKL